MSLFDESFPDAFLENSFNEGHARTMAAEMVPKSKPIPTTTTTTTIKTPTTTTTTTKSPSSSNDQSRHESESTPGSGAGTVAVSGVAKSHEACFKSKPTAGPSLQDIHLRYTRRHFKHVESKVGLYIASIKEEDRQRRLLKFQRHNSLPTSMSMSTASSAGQLQAKLNCFSVRDLRKSAERDVDGDAEAEAEAEGDTEANSSTHTNAMTSSAYSSSNGGGVSTSGDDGVGIDGHSNCVEKVAHTQLQLEYTRLKDELEFTQLQLDEKFSDNVRLRRNIDLLRIDIMSCQDKLKRLNDSGGSMRSHGCSYSSQTLFRSFPSTATTASQTDFGAAALRTPIQALKHENGGAAAANVLRQRTNSNGSSPLSRFHVRPATYASSIDTGFDSQSVGVIAAKLPMLRRAATPPSSSEEESTESETLMLSLNGSGLRTKHKPKAKQMSKSKQQQQQQQQQLQPMPLTTTTTATTAMTTNPRRGKIAALKDYVYHERPACRYASLPLQNVSSESDIVFEGATSEAVSMDTLPTSSCAPGCDAHDRRPSRQLSFRHRFLRLFGRCVRCDDPNRSIDFYARGGEDVDAIEMLQTPSSLSSTGKGKNPRRKR